MSTTREQFVDWCYGRLGAPVIWCAKSDYAIDGDRVRVTLPAQLPAFDCSGIHTCGLLALTGKDYRGQHDAQDLYDLLEPVDSDKRQPGDLGFFGTSPSNVVHVVVSLKDGHVLSADGATSLQWNWTKTSDRRPPIEPMSDDDRRTRMLKAIEASRAQGNTVRLYHWPMARHGYIGWRSNKFLEGWTP